MPIRWPMEGRVDDEARSRLSTTAGASAWWVKPELLSHDITREESYFIRRNNPTREKRLAKGAKEKNKSHSICDSLQGSACLSAA